MNDERRDEHLVRGFFADTAPSRSPDDLLDDVFLSTGRMRPRPRWLALLKEPPMRTSSTLAVGSPTVRVAAIAAATLLLAASLIAAGIAGQRLLAADTTIIVAQDGSGDATTITAGVDMAGDGDTVLIRPGTYIEAVMVESDITIAGDGPRDEIVLRIPDDGAFEPWPILDGARPRFPELRYGFFLSGSDATVRDLTVTGPPHVVTGFLVRGGSPTITRNVVDIDPSGQVTARGLAYIGGGADVTLSDNLTDAFTWIDEGATATVTGNRKIEGGADEVGVRVDHSTATISGNELNGVYIGLGGVAEVRDNDVVGPATGNGCLVALLGSEPGVIIEANRVSGANQGICLEGPDTAVLRGNDLSGLELFGARIEGGDVTFIDNTITASGIGIVVRGSSPMLEGNTLEGNRVGLAVLDDATPVLVGNRSCGNETNLHQPEGTVPIATDGNEICANTAPDA